jgi:Fur family transcriptional regulator, zinc uptake regulator
MKTAAPRRRTEPVVPDVPALPKDGSQAMALRLEAAATACRARGAQLTALRREVLELLLRRGGRAKAYDLQEDLQARHGRVAPTTVYRALDFLMAQRLVHRVDAMNAFVACDHDHPHAKAMLVVCAGCGDIAEWHDDPALHALEERLQASHPGFADSTIEIKGRCARCVEASPA